MGLRRFLTGSAGGGLGLTRALGVGGGVLAVVAWGEVGVIHAHGTTAANQSRVWTACKAWDEKDPRLRASTLVRHSLWGMAGVRPRRLVRWRH